MEKVISLGETILLLAVEVGIKLTVVILQSVEDTPTVPASTQGTAS